MLLYNFHCQECGKTMAESTSDRTKCRLCGGKVKLVRIICRNGSAINANARKTVYSRAMAIDASQLKEARQTYPDRNYVWNDREQIYMLEVNGARHQAKLAKEHGMVDYSGTRVAR